jgi:hypothetical protein
MLSGSRDRLNCRSVLCDYPLVLCLQVLLYLPFSCLGLEIAHLICGVRIWVMGPCNLVGGYKCFRERHCIRHQEV